MFHKAKAQITANGSGAATVYIGPIKGALLSLKYSPGTLATGTDLTITGETSGVQIMAKVDAGTSDVFYYPRAKANEVADGAQASAGTEVIPLVDERIKVVVAQGGSGGVGEIEATWLAPSPY